MAFLFVVHQYLNKNVVPSAKTSQQNAVQAGHTKTIHVAYSNVVAVAMTEYDINQLYTYSLCIPFFSIFQTQAIENF